MIFYAILCLKVIINNLVFIFSLYFFATNIEKCQQTYDVILKYHVVLMQISIYIND